MSKPEGYAAAMNVLGIETSCDETAAAVVGADGVLSDVIHTQLEHEAFGGVVPELAARAHQERLVRIVRGALSQAGVDRPDAVAATGGPGLVGALLVGFSFGKALALAWDVPFVVVNHLEGHALSPLLDDPPPVWPFLSVVVSGGHTSIYVCEGLDTVSCVAETVDDAAGEAFDKVARMMDLGYPGGPAVDRLAAQGDAQAVSFPRPHPGGLNFSFAGLKTAVRQYLQKPQPASDADVCASFQAAVVDCLLDRSRGAMEATGIRRIAFTGGVAANGELRRRSAELDAEVFLPPRARCTDNGAMIANVGRMRLVSGHADQVDAQVRPRWPIGT